MKTNKHQNSSSDLVGQSATEHQELSQKLKRDELLNSADKQKLSQASEKLDKYYTKQSVADFCYEQFKNFLIDKKQWQDHFIFIEPSAGSGVFLSSVQEKIYGFDIAPAHPDIQQHNFLTDDLYLRLNKQDKKQPLIIIGNPPFGTKSKLAIEFVNKSLEYSDWVGFILPIQFRKWSVQSKISTKASLVLDLELPEYSFEFMGKDYGVRCCFQIWSKHQIAEELDNLRIQTKPSTEHPDFKMYQYNRTEEALKFFDVDWDFAVYRQGYHDYTQKMTTPGQCDKKHQWIFFKAKNKTILKRLKSLDFVSLSKKNIGIPGFGKADVVQAYCEKYNKEF